ncbi:MAG: cysteine--tRNA ligase [Chloroherpetonaceae bacterium]|nr:cysteine--tRNA ligase [Chloroherpetonaceae bacterium]
MSYPEISIYNTLSRKKERFTSQVEGFISMYVCGPTVYGHSHIGHAKSYISFDVMVRLFREVGYRVRYVQNITDVGHLTDNADEGEDKIAAKARAEKLEPIEIAQAYTRSYFDDMDALGVLRADIAPTAAGHIPEQIDLITSLIEKGHAYEVNGSVYFDVTSFAGYGKLSGRVNQEDLESGTRVAVKSEKKNPSDFALWKKADTSHIMRWNSPWGVGFPGWHIECSAMSMRYLGETIDIHGGGLENQFPHHECEIAQSEAATGKPFVRYWIHNNMVTVAGQKMGKSLGNFTTIKDALAKIQPLALRFFVLQSHYRSTLDFTDEALFASKAGYEKLLDTYMRLLTSSSTDRSENLPDDFIVIAEREIMDALCDDFNTPGAIASLFDFSRELNRRIAEGLLTQNEKNRSVALFEKYGGRVLGIIPSEVSSQSSGRNASQETLTKVMALVLDLRKEVRAKKDFATSDFIRDRLKEAGIEVKDTKSGTEWKLS